MYSASRHRSHRYCRSVCSMICIGMLTTLGSCGKAPSINDLPAGASSPPSTLSPQDADTVKSNSANPAWVPAPPAAGEKVYPGIGLRTIPAPANLKLESDSEAAMRTAEVSEFVDRGLATGVPDIEIRLVTTGDFPPGSTVENRVVKQPAWVLTFHHSPVDYKGGSYESPAPPRPTVTCEFLIVEDAVSLGHILTAQICPDV